MSGRKQVTIFGQISLNFLHPVKSLKFITKVIDENKCVRILRHYTLVVTLRLDFVRMVTKVVTLLKDSFWVLFRA